MTFSAATLDLSKVNWFLFIGGGRPSRRQYKCRSVVSHGPNKRGVARPTSAHCPTQWCMSRNAKNQPKKSICKNFKGLLFQVTANINPKLIAKHFWTKENIKSCFVQIWKIFHLNADWRFHIWEIWWPKCPILFILWAGRFFRFFGLITNARLCNFFLWTQFTLNPGPVNMIFLPMKNLFGVLEKYKSKLHLLTFWTQILAEFPFLCCTDYLKNRCNGIWIKGSHPKQI